MSEKVDIFETLAAHGTFTTLLKALEATGLVDYVKGPGPFTFFAPTDQAFFQLPEWFLGTLLDEPAGRLRQILLRHVLADSMSSADLTDGLELLTSSGRSLSVTVDSDLILIDDALITQADLPASNGVVHAVDSVIIPPLVTLTGSVSQEPLLEDFFLEA